MIAIKSMKNIPKSCSECELKSGSYCYHKKPPYDLNGINLLKEKPKDCPLVEIITCKNCKHRRGEVCRNYRHIINDDFFCADGERREKNV